MIEPPARLRPRAFRLDDARVALDEAPAHAQTSIFITREDAPIPVVAGTTTPAAAPTRKSFSARLPALIAAGLGGLVSLSVGLWADRLIEDLFARSPAFGVLALIFAALALVGGVGWISGEIRAYRRQTRIERLHAGLGLARLADDRIAARRLIGELVALYAERPETARGRAEVRDAAGAIVDGRDLVDVAERALLRPLDVRARAEIASAARRTSLVTAVSPRAIFDVVFVGAQVLRLTRRIAEIYGGRPGMLGFVRLLREIAGHVALTGGMAVGDGVLQQLLGHGLASKISARMGEGVLNGLLTARVGLAAMRVCRPAPFGIDPEPGIADVAPFLFGADKER